ncbi:MAG TPA: RNA 2',3'-cyclic phosphodiesterase [Candidatus Polarisedimenticolia bacterium]|nr:RNA 2',3'-cyclic phosphodiesterase [Candidatus Polarisedimenticolia bacterium]
MEGGGLKIEDGGSSAGGLRLFVAISPPEDVKDQIEKAQRELRDVLQENSVRWTKRDQFHLTLKFLGNVAAPRVAELIESLRVACSQFKALPLHAERIGFFPNMRYPRVVWAWVHDGGEFLPKLQQAIESSVKNFTVEEPEGEFTGHVTLGRVQRIKRPQAEILAKKALEMVNRSFGEWTANNIELIRSELLPGGSRYTTLAEIPFLEKS